MADVTKLFELPIGSGSAVLDWKPSPEVKKFMAGIKDYALSESGITEEGGEGIGSLLAAGKAIYKLKEGEPVKTPEFSVTDDDLTELLIGADVVGVNTRIDQPFGLEDATLEARGKINRDNDVDNAELFARLNLAFHGGGAVQVEEEEDFSSPDPIEVPLSEVQPVNPVDDTSKTADTNIVPAPAPIVGAPSSVVAPAAQPTTMPGHPQVLPEPLPSQPAPHPTAYAQSDIGIHQQPWNPSLSGLTEQNYFGVAQSDKGTHYIKPRIDRTGGGDAWSPQINPGTPPHPWHLQEEMDQKLYEWADAQASDPRRNDPRYFIPQSDAGYVAQPDTFGGPGKLSGQPIAPNFNNPLHNLAQLGLNAGRPVPLIEQHIPIPQDIRNPRIGIPPWRQYNNSEVDPRRPIKRAEGGLIDQIQRPEIYGRGDDTMMMHVTPDEVRGLMSLFPGAITQNPYTGYPEAGGLGDAFKKILPALAIAAITYFTLGAGTAPALGAMGGMGVGAGTGAGTAAATTAATAGTAGGWMAAGGPATAAGFTGASAIPAAAGVGSGLSYGMGPQAYAASGAPGAITHAAQASGMAGLKAGASPGLGGAGFSGSSPAALQASMAGAETVPTAYGASGKSMGVSKSGALTGYRGEGMGAPQTGGIGDVGFSGSYGQPKGLDYGDAIRRMAAQAQQGEEEQPPPQTPMSVKPLQRKDTGLDEMIAASAEELQAPQTPGVETSGLGLDDPSMGLGDVSDEELEEAIIGYRRGGKVDHGGMLVGPSSTLTTGGGLVVGGKMNKDGTFPVDGVHTQIHDGTGKAVQEARLNNGEVVISGGGVAGLGKLMGAPPHKETEAGADYLMQLQRKAESMNKGGTHLSPTNMRPSYGFGLS